MILNWTINTRKHPKMFNVQQIKTNVEIPTEKPADFSLCLMSVSVDDCADQHSNVAQGLIHLGTSCTGFSTFRLIYEVSVDFYASKMIYSLFLLCQNNLSVHCAISFP